MLGSDSYFETGHASPYVCYNMGHFSLQAYLRQNDSERECVVSIGDPPGSKEHCKACRRIVKRSLAMGQGHIG